MQSFKPWKIRKTASVCMGLSVLLGLLTIASTGCDVMFPGQDSPWQSAFGLEIKDNVTLRIENQSGMPVEVEATFTSLEQAVRQTSRRLSAAGGDAFEEIVPTGAEVVTVVARRISGDKSDATAAAGDVIQEQVFHRGVDFTGTETILFAILPVEEPTPPDPLPVIDCNDNGLADSDELTANPSADCNGDGLLDECQSLTDCNDDGIPDECQDLTDCNEDGIPDECQNLTDCNEDGIPDECQNLTDCNDDGIPDECQFLPDYNENGTPDECEIEGDFDGDGKVTMDDLPLFLQLLLAGGSQNFPPGADINGDGVFDGRDIQPLINLILAQA